MKNIEDVATLVAVGFESRLDADKLKAVLESNEYADAVQADMQESQQLGVQGVPFFVFDRKYAISGAQDSKAFLETLETSFSEWKQANPQAELQVSEGPNCTLEKDCD